MTALVIAILVAVAAAIASEVIRWFTPLFSAYPIKSIAIAALFGAAIPFLNWTISNSIGVGDVNSIHLNEGGYISVACASVIIGISWILAVTGYGWTKGSSK